MITWGRYTYGYDQIQMIDHNGDLHIGSFCSIGPNLKALLLAGHRIDWATTYPFGRVFKDKFNEFDGEGGEIIKGDIRIGNDVWIGRDVSIMGGINVGDGAVIAANSHVVNDVKPYTVVGGNPAKLLYYRFDQETIQKLLELKWWNFDDEMINKISPLLCSNNFTDLFEMCKNYKNENV